MREAVDELVVVGGTELTLSGDVQVDFEEVGEKDDEIFFLLHQNVGHELPLHHLLVLIGARLNSQHIKFRNRLVYFAVFDSKILLDVLIQFLIFRFQIAQVKLDGILRRLLIQIKSQILYENSLFETKSLLKLLLLAHLS